MAAEDYFDISHMGGDEWEGDGLTSTKLIHYTGIREETEKAILFISNGGDFWLPRSPIDVGDLHIEVPYNIKIKYIKRFTIGGTSQ